MAAGELRGRRVMRHASRRLPRVAHARVGSARAEPTVRRPPLRPWRADLRRSVRLLAASSGYEQPDPARFYTALAEDSVGQLSQLRRPGRRARCSTSAAGPGYFRDAFRAAGRDVPRRSTPTSASSPGSARSPPGTVIGSGMQLPFARRLASTSATPPTCSSTSADPWRMADEMLRVTRPGGMVFLSYTVWFGPWGGHETAPVALPRRPPGAAPLRAQARPRAQEQVRRVAVPGHRRATGCAGPRRQAGPRCSTLTPALQPAVVRWLLRVPVLREVVTWNLVIVLRKRVSASRPRDRSRTTRPRCVGCVRRAARRRSPSSRTPGCWSPTPSSTWPSTRAASSAGRCTCGTPRAPSASCRTRPTATCGRWARSSRSATLARPARLGRAAAVVAPGAVRRVRRHGRGWPGRSASRSDLACLLGRLRLRAVAADAHASWARSRSRPGRARSRPGCCCRWSSGLERGSTAPGGRAAGAGGGDGRRRQRGRHVRGAAARASSGCSPATPRSAAPQPDALVAGRSPRSARCGGWCRCSLLGAYSPPFLDFIETRRRSRPFPTDAVRRAARHVGLGALRRHRPAQGGQRPDHDRLPRRSNSGVLLCSGWSGCCAGATRTGSSSSLSLLLGLLLVTLGHAGRVAGLVRRIAARRCSTARWRRCATCTSSTRSSGCRWSWAWPACSTGCARAVAATVARAAGSAVLDRVDRRVAVLGAASAVVGRRAARRWPGSSRPRGPVSDVPGYWQRGRRLAGAHSAGDDVALLAPGSRVRRLRLGHAPGRAAAVPRRSPAGRSATPSRWRRAGNIRMLDAVEDRLAQGKRLDRAGARTCAAPASGYLVVRNDLRPSRRRARPGAGAPGAGRSPGLHAGRDLRARASAAMPVRRARRLPDRGQRRLAEPVARRSRSTRSPAPATGPSAAQRAARRGRRPRGPARPAGPRRARRRSRRSSPPTPRATRRPTGRSCSPTGCGTASASSAACTTATPPSATPGDGRTSGNPVARLPARRRRPLVDDRAARRSAARSSASSSHVRLDTSRRARRPADAAVRRGRRRPGRRRGVSDAGSRGAPGGGSTSTSAVDLTAGRRDAARGAPARSGSGCSPRAGRSEDVVLDPGTTTPVAVAGRARPRGSGSRTRRRPGPAVPGRGAVAGSRLTRTLVLPDAAPRRGGAPTQVLLRALRDARTGCAGRRRATRAASQDRAAPPRSPRGVDRVVTLPEAGGVRRAAVTRACPVPASTCWPRLQRDQPSASRARRPRCPDAARQRSGRRRRRPGTTWTADRADARPS